jgi:hypothetical protein
MKTYVVTFEIADKTRLSLLEERLKSESGYYCPIHENAWAVQSEKTAAQLRDELMKITTNPDRLFIIKSGIEAAWTNTYGEKNSEWLKKYL